MEGELERILQALDDLYQNAPCGYHSLDAEGIFLRINDTALDWLALSRDEVVGKLKFSDIVFPQDRDLSTLAFDSLLNGEKIRDLEIRMMRRCGTPFPVLVTADTVRGENHFVMSRSVPADASRLESAEKALQTLIESDGRYRALIAALPDGILLLSPEGVILSCNPAAEHILCMSCTGLVGSKFSEFEGNFFAEDGSRFPGGNFHHAFSGKPARNVVMGVKKLEDGMTWINVNSETLYYPENGMPFAIMITFSDISERKRQGEELQQSYKALKELSFRLAHAREAERSNVAREIHDELGSTLTSVKFDLSWAVEKNGNREPFEEVFRGLDAAIRSVKKICTALRPSVLDDLGLLAALEWQLGQFGKKTGIRCRIIKHGAEPSLPQDVATGIFRIFQETLTNIARHAEASRVMVEFRHDETEILLTVTDNGKGIDPVKTAGSKSLGILGMSERAQALGGMLSVHPATPRGTRVALSIPHERRASDRPSAASIP